jgi:hypothetical protein
MRTAVSLSFLLLLVGCTEDRVQSVVNSPSPDHKYVAIVRDVLAENTTGSTPQLFVLPAGQTLRGDSGQVADGNLNGSFAVSWASPDSLLVEFTAGEWAPKLPAVTNFGGITIAFRSSQ